MTDIGDTAREGLPGAANEMSTTRSWLTQMLREGKSPLRSLDKQFSPKQKGRKLVAVNTLILAAAPLEDDTPSDAELKREFVRQAVRWKEQR